MRSVSMTRRLVVALLLLELVSAAALIATIAAHERHVQFRAFDASLVGASESLMGAVQDAEDANDNVLLDLRTVRIARDAVYRVEDGRGHVLGACGDLSGAFPTLAATPGFHDQVVGRCKYRFYTLHGLRIIDPGEPNGGTSYNVIVVYGTPPGRIWHEVFEQIRFYSAATAILLGATALLMVGIIRRRLSPLHALAAEADRITSSNWLFHAPASAQETVELRPLARALESALERVHRSFEQQKRFTSDAAHELKTDVAIVKSSLQLLSMRKRSAEEYEEGLALSLNDTTRLEETVQKLLTLARLEQPAETGAAEKQPWCSLREAMEEAVHQSDPLAQMKGAQVRMESMGEAVVGLDRRDAVLLCGNLLVNALQHSSVEGPVLLSLREEKHRIVLMVKDWGEGILEDDRPHLFHPFYRGDVSRSRKSGGTGLGLSICKAICDRAGGSIDIANHKEGGAVVTVVLPAYPGDSVPAFSGSLKP